MDERDDINQVRPDNGSNEPYVPQHEKPSSDNSMNDSYRQQPHNSDYIQPGYEHSQNTNYNQSGYGQPQNTNYSQSGYSQPQNNSYSQSRYNQPQNNGYYQQGYNQPQNNGYRQAGYSQPQNNGFNQQNYRQSQNNSFSQQQNNGFNQYDGYNDQPRRPVYDRFMYEPIGFEDPNDNQQFNTLEVAQKQRSKGEKGIIILFILITAIAGFLAIFGIIFDIVNSENVIKKIGSPNQIVIYQESKPEGANDLENFKDENGKYTPEGAAALVKPSIVKIYTYENYQTYAAKRPLGTGSGIVLNEDGYIVTNAHVLEAEGYHKIETSDGKFYDAKVVGRDTKTDIAVIKVEGADLTPAVLGNSDEAIVGETVIAIGNPANLAGTVTDGIISAVDRKIRSDSSGFEMKCLQTNAEISPGNSGGALVNMYGQVIGITSSKYVSSDLEGLGFAITINEATPVIEELVKNGFIAGRFRIGIHLLDMSSDEKIGAIEERMGYTLPDDFKGIYIDSIDDDCDIANTELKNGDFIIAINGKSVSTYDELYDTISGQYEAGDTVPATCASVDKNGKVNYYEIEFKLMEDKSGNY
ncbi:MAG: trypsin-like peptidase domain-containing protein [Ruminococcus sp.]|nr:trypsin-like peptidase domain-containing protein [Ruminococcus sp.]